MYKNFTPTTDGGYTLKKQGMMSTVLIGGAFMAIAIGSLVSYIKTSQNNLLFYGPIMAAGGLFMFWRSTRQFIIYPNQQIFKYSKGKGVAFQEFRFDELDGVTQEKMKDIYGLTLSTTFVLGFEKDGKQSKILLGQNISAKTMRTINEEMQLIMSSNQGK
jgi:hypothetical protein